MKKIFCLCLAALLIISAIPMVHAADYRDGTRVEYTASVDDNREYTITVPALLTPKVGETVSGSVTLKGKWASNETITITADPKVTLTNNLNADNTKDLVVTLTPMSYTGNNTEEKTYVGTVSLAEMPADALFGVWSGKFNYNVEFDDGEINFTIKTTDMGTIEQDFSAPAGTTWGEFVEQEFLFSVYNDMIWNGYGYVHYNDVLVQPGDLIIDNAIYTVTS